MSLLVSGADPLVVESTPAYHLWCHLFSCTKGGAEAGRAFPNFRFGRLVVELLLTSFVKWLHDMLSVVSGNLAMTYHLWFEGFLLMEHLEHAKRFPHLILDVVLHCTSFRLLLCSGVFSAKTTLYLPRVL